MIIRTGPPRRRRPRLAPEAEDDEEVRARVGDGEAEQSRHDAVREQREVRVQGALLRANLSLGPNARSRAFARSGNARPGTHCVRTFVRARRMRVRARSDTTYARSGAFGYQPAPASPRQPQ